MISVFATKFLHKSFSIASAEVVNEIGAKHGAGTNASVASPEIVNLSTIHNTGFVVSLLNSQIVHVIVYKANHASQVVSATTGNVANVIFKLYHLSFNKKGWIKVHAFVSNVIHNPFKWR